MSDTSYVLSVKTIADTELSYQWKTEALTYESAHCGIVNNQLRHKLYKLLILIFARQNKFVC